MPVPLHTLLDIHQRTHHRPLDELAQNPAVAAVFNARRDWLNAPTLLELEDEALADRLIAFADVACPPFLHPGTLRRHVRMVRFGIGHMLHATWDLAARLRSCAAPGETYSVAGIGEPFWLAVAQAIDPLRHPDLSHAPRLALEKGGILEPNTPLDEVWMRASAWYLEPIRQYRGVTALHLSAFLTRVAGITGRELEDRAPRLPASASPASPTSPASLGRGSRLADEIRLLRSRKPLKRRLKEQSESPDPAQFQQAIAEGDASAVWQVLLPGRVSESIQAEVLLDWCRRLTAEADPEAAMAVVEAFWHADPLPGVGPDLPIRILHKHRPTVYPMWSAATRRGLSEIDAGFAGSESAREGYPLWREACETLRAGHGVHSSELDDLLTRLAEPSELPFPHPGFRGFCSATFRFLTDLAADNRSDWMRERRDLYQFAVREPLAELCSQLAARYVDPILAGQHGWDIETEARPGKALTSINRNDHGQSVPYQTSLWITFYRRGSGRREDVQFFVHLAADGLRYGIRIGRHAREVLRRLRRNIQQHAANLFADLSARGAIRLCPFTAHADDDTPSVIPIRSEGDLRAWSAGREFSASRFLPADSPMLRGDDLVGEILMTFDRLLPIWVCGCEEDPADRLTPANTTATHAGDPEAFLRETGMSAVWLERTLSLLQLRRQLILQGVPGTGKTHVARSLARMLSGGHEDAVSLVQFHPSVSYEEFVEGIRPRAVEVDGRTEISYPVEEGILCRAAARAEAQPTRTHVLLIDEINRGNLPKIFGELLYLLEYREMSVTLPVSRRAFRLPSNLILIGTMNATDRSVAVIDQALRRRFSFVEMPPDETILARYLEAHPPQGEHLAPQVLRLFGELNRKLSHDLGEAYRIGHSFLMVEGLDADRLRMIWEHQIYPQLEEYFSLQPQRLKDYDLAGMAGGEWQEGRRAKRKSRGN